MKLYDATHSLNAQARLDRYEWLKKQIGHAQVSPGALEKVPGTR